MASARQRFTMSMGAAHTSRSKIIRCLRQMGTGLLLAAPLTENPPDLLANPESGDGKSHCYESDALRSRAAKPAPEAAAAWISEIIDTQGAAGDIGLQCRSPTYGA